MRSIIAACAIGLAFNAVASDVGVVKTTSGAVHIERDGGRMLAQPGSGVRQSDVLVTGADGTVGVTFNDNSLLSAGPNTVLQIERYAFNPTTHAGHFDASLKRGSLAVISGKMVKQSPDAMRVRTPSSIMGVRGTEFVVRVD